MAYRVAQASTGNVGAHALSGIIGHPDLELVGLWVHSPTKVGRDAGELIGLPPAGVTATDDLDQILALEPDCVVYTASGDLRPQEAVADMQRILESGANVVATSVVPLVYPPSADPRVVAKLTRSCEAGGTSCFTSGIDPGFANDFLPLALTGVAERVDSVRVLEILDYSTYDQWEILHDIMGFGRPVDADDVLLLLPGSLTLAWGCVVHAIADGLDVPVDRIDEVHERLPAHDDIHLPGGVVPKGSTAALRFEVRGIVGGEPRIVVEHVTRLHGDLAPDWPQPAGHGGYRIKLEGSPRMTVDFAFEGEDGDHNTGGLILTAMRIVNAIPAVCEAPPGLLSVLDLPLVTGRHLMPAT